jgi:hypothetical protein
MAAEKTAYIVLSQHGDDDLNAWAILNPTCRHTAPLMRSGKP